MNIIWRDALRRVRRSINNLGHDGAWPSIIAVAAAVLLVGCATPRETKERTTTTTTVIDQAPVVAPDTEIPKR